MATIAIIDDNLEQSETLKTALSHHLEKLKNPITVITQFPFKKKSEYFKFILDGDICLLIIDERLNDQSCNNSGPVSYKGNELVVYLRMRLKDFPIYAVSTFDTDEDLVARSSEFEAIVKRETFIDSGSIYARKLVRAAQRYLESHAKELAEYENLTKKVARGNTDQKVVQRLKALQAKLELPITGFEDRATWLNEYEKQISQLEKLRDVLRLRIRKQK